MQITQFREILFLPLDFTQKHGSKSFFDAIDGVLKPGSHWVRVDDLSWRDPEADPITRYGEFHYFHRFIRGVLFSGGGAPETGGSRLSEVVRVYSRSDITRLRMNVWNSKGKGKLEKDLEFAVERIQLFLFDLGLGILLFEVSSPEPLQLDTVQTVLDVLRRVYPPYFEKQKGESDAPRRVVESFQWISASGKDLRQFDLEADRKNWLNLFHLRKADDPKSADSRRVKAAKPLPALDEHWRYLLEPFRYAHLPETSSADIGHASSLTYELFGDDRAPVMAYLAAACPRLISRGDWARIAFCDDPGPELGHPSSPRFLEDFERRYCYDRFWHSVDDGIHGWMSSRYTICGYAFCMVGDVQSREFTNQVSGILSHFRHHYALMGLLVHLQHAVLLSLSHRLAEAVDRFELEIPEKRRRFHREVEAIHLDFLRFTHRFWFEDITGQIQGQELYRLWREHLKLPQLYQEVMAESQAINQFLDGYEQKRQADEQMRQADEQKRQADEQGYLAKIAVRIAMIGVPGVLIGLVLTAFTLSPEIPWHQMSEVIRAWPPSLVFWAVLLATFRRKNGFFGIRPATHKNGRQTVP